VIDLLMEIMLLEKVVRGGRKEKERAQFLYQHSKWLVRLLEELAEGKDVLELCQQSKYLRQS
jgi:hypothetical protein